MELFGCIGTGLTAVLEAGLTVRWYICVDKSPMSIRVARHHLHMLMVLYSHQVHPTAIRGCFLRFFCDVTLINEVDLRHLSLVNMVIAG